MAMGTDIKEEFRVKASELESLVKADKDMSESVMKRWEGHISKILASLNNSDADFKGVCAAAYRTFWQMKNRDVPEQRIGGSTVDTSLGAVMTWMQEKELHISPAMGKGSGGMRMWAGETIKDSGLQLNR